MKTLLLLAGLLLGLNTGFAAPSQFPGLIRWKVGDRMEYQTSFSVVGKIGSMTVEVTKDEGTAVWLTKHIVLPAKNDTQQILVNRTDGTVLKYFQNGREAPYPDDSLENISQSKADVTVPAGSFSSLHTRGNQKGGGLIETWTNPEATAIDGMIKTVIDQQTTFELTAFHRGG